MLTFFIDTLVLVELRFGLAGFFRKLRGQFGGTAVKSRLRQLCGVLERLPHFLQAMESPCLKICTYDPEAGFPKGLRGHPGANRGLYAASDGERRAVTGRTA